MSDQELSVLFESETEKKIREKKLGRANREKADAESYNKEISDLVQ